MKYTFVCEDDDRKVTMEFSGDQYDSWAETLDRYQEFLAGCGFIFFTNFNLKELAQAEHQSLIDKQFPKEPE